MTVYYDTLYDFYDADGHVVEIAMSYRNARFIYGEDIKNLRHEITKLPTKQEVRQ